MPPFDTNVRRLRRATRTSGTSSALIGVAIALFASVALCAGRTASAAGLVGLGALTQIMETPDGPRSVIDVHAVFTATYFVVDRVESATIHVGGGFGSMVHVPSADPSDWSPQASPPGAIDSFVTIGGMPGPLNVTQPGAGWGASGFESVSIPRHAGWKNAMPIVLQGKASHVPGLGPATLLARFVSEPRIGGTSAALSMSATIVYNIGPGTPMMSTFASIDAAFPPALNVADINGDGVVDGIDLGILLTQLGSSGTADLDGNGVVDGVDLGILLENWSAR